jgi:hypothetical protein
MANGLVLIKRLQGVNRNSHIEQEQYLSPVRTGKRELPFCHDGVAEPSHNATLRFHKLPSLRPIGLRLQFNWWIRRVPRTSGELKNKMGL